MSKFEEYDLYARNKDFLVSERILTFTDVNGKLMALKPDVTLSIVRHVRQPHGEGGSIQPGVVQKIFYDENVYRVPRRAGGHGPLSGGAFREIPQVGLECLGDVDRYCVCEVLSLAAESLRLVAAPPLAGEPRACVLDISHLGVLSAVLEGVPQASRQALLHCIAGKNVHELARLCGEAGVPEERAGLLKALIELYGRPADVLPGLRRSLEASRLQPEGADNLALACLEELERVVDALGDEPMLRVDLSAVSDLSYYNGIVFRGFIEGVPESVLSGGQYDRLMERMGRGGARAIGFAV